MPQNVVPDVTESEQELISRAQTAVSQCNWVVGECAAKWTVKYAKGRTDADFAAQVGLSPDQVYQRRRVWETFGEVYQTYPSLKWSHFYVALSWDDATDCLQWAEENQATVAEMKAWRKAIHGEDLASEPEPDAWSGDPAVTFVPTEPTAVRDPQEVDRQIGQGGADSGGLPSRAGESAETLGRVARAADTDEAYAPYRQQARSPAPAESAAETAVLEKPRPEARTILKRMIQTVERVNRALTGELIDEMRRLPTEQRERFVKAVAELSTKAAQLT